MTVLIDAKRGDYIISQFLLNGYLTDDKLTDEMLYPLGVSIGGLCDWIDFYTDLRALTDFAVAVWLEDKYVYEKLNEVYEEDKNLLSNEPSGLELFMNKYFPKDKDRTKKHMIDCYLSYMRSNFIDLIQLALKTNNLYKIKEEIRIEPVERTEIYNDIWFSKRHIKRYC